MESKLQVFKESAKSQMLHFLFKNIIRKLKQNPKTKFNISTYQMLVSILDSRPPYLVVT